MSRISIDVSDEQHQRLKAIAALKGQSIKDYVLERALPSPMEQKSLDALETFLQPRIEEAEREEIVSKSVQDIFEEVLESQ